MLDDFIVAWLAQLREHRSAEQVVAGSNSQDVFEITPGIFLCIYFCKQAQSVQFFRTNCLLLQDLQAREIKLVTDFEQVG